MTARSGFGRLLPGHVGVGTAALGGLYRSVPPEVARETLVAAWNAGFRYFDTAPHYGVGLAEERLGMFLADHPGAVTSTKVGRLLLDDPKAPTEGEGFWGTPRRTRRWDFSREGVLRGLEESTQRAGVDAFDIIFLHDPDFAVAADPRHQWDILDQALPTLAELRRQGVIRAFGVGMNDADRLSSFVRNADLDIVLIAGRLTLLDQSAMRALLPAAHERGTAVVVGGVFNSGVLADPDGNYDYAPPSEEIRQRVIRLRRTCDAFGVDLVAAALQFPLRHPDVDAVLIGPRSPAEVETSNRLLAAPLPEELWAALDGLGVVSCG